MLESDASVRDRLPAPGSKHKLTLELDTTRSKKQHFEGRLIIETRGCRSQGADAGDASRVIPIAVTVVDPQQIRQEANDFARQAGIPVVLCRFRIARIRAVRAGEERETAEWLLGGTEFLNRAGRPAGVAVMDDGELDPAVADLAESMSSFGLASNGQFRAEATWNLDDGGTFSTRASWLKTAR